MIAITTSSSIKVNARHEKERERRRGMEEPPINPNSAWSGWTIPTCWCLINNSQFLSIACQEDFTRKIDFFNFMAQCPLPAQLRVITCFHHRVGFG